MRMLIQRGFAETPEGQIHYAVSGRGDPVLMLHQTPRSWDEYRDVLPILGNEFRVFAMDTIGFGESYKPDHELDIEDYARGAIAFMDAVSIKKASIVGHHTGGVIAVEIAASYPERVDRLVLSSTPYVDAEDRKRRKARSPIDEVEVQNDGSHLTALWRKRMPFYPKGRPDLLQRFVVDAMKVIDRIEDGHRAVGRYEMERKTPLIKAPTLVLVGRDDPFAYPCAWPLAESIELSQTRIIDRGMVPMVDQLPDAFARAVLDFIKQPESNRGQ